MVLVRTLFYVKNVSITENSKFNKLLFTYTSESDYQTNIIHYKPCAIDRNKIVSTYLFLPEPLKIIILWIF